MRRTSHDSRIRRSFAVTFASLSAGFAAQDDGQAHRRYVFTNRRISTFSIRPTAMKNIIVDDPP